MAEEMKVKGEQVEEGEAKTALDYAATTRKRRRSLLAVYAMVFGVTAGPAGFVSGFILFGEMRRDAAIRMVWYYMFPVVAVVLGLVALYRIRRSSGQLWGTTLAVFGMLFAFWWLSRRFLGTDIVLW